jgi:hypothetical protein
MGRNTIKQQSSVQSCGDQPTTMPNEHQSYRETSHVFYCMQCDLQVQLDIAVPTRKASAESGEGMVRVRLDSPCYPAQT